MATKLTYKEILAKVLEYKPFISDSDFEIFMEGIRFAESIYFPELIFKQYKRKDLLEMRPYILGEDLSKISVNEQDTPEADMGMIARNSKNHNDMWYVARKYFDENLEPA